MTDYTNPPDGVIHAAIEEAMKSPCAKSKRGVVLTRRVWFGHQIVGRGHNHPPASQVCTGSGWCRESCSRLCVHAEAAALRDIPVHALPVLPVDGRYEAVRDAGPFDLVHVKVVDGELVAGGGPSCWQCARDLLEDGRVANVWLYLEPDLLPWQIDRERWRRYTMDEFYAATMRHCGLPERSP